VEVWTKHWVFFPTENGDNYHPKINVDPDLKPIFSGFTNLPTPMTARVNLPESKSSINETIYVFNGKNEKCWITMENHHV
jgi:hypothetical protein